MKHWFTRPDAPLDRSFLKRFDPQHWTVDFPRGSMASLLTGPIPNRMEIEATFLRRGDLVGLIWESEDRHAHPGRARETNRDYSGCRLRFRWQSTGLNPLDAINGPTLTIEGKDPDGADRTWFVRLWNYAQGSPTDATVALDFDRLDGGFGLPADADRVDPRAIERMFISLVPPDYLAGSTELRTAPASGRVTLSGMDCTGPGSTTERGDAIAPENGLSICTAYDDMYHQAPARIVEQIIASGYRGTINHYVGMSHFLSLGGDGLVDPAKGLSAPALAWHRELARCAKDQGLALIWSLSFELLDMFTPEEWKQRDWDGAPALTGYDPPSTLLSPANDEAMAYLGRIAAQLVGISLETGLEPRFQVGEPWWWVAADGRIFLYDSHAIAAFGGTPAEIADVGASLTAVQRGLLDQAGAMLASATAAVTDAALAVAPETVTHVLAYLPGLLDPSRPEVRRANLPIGWAAPAFDVLQLEDYEWVTDGRSALRAAAWATVEARLGYPVTAQHYLSGFVARGERRDQWPAILGAAREARARGVAETFVWAWPQVARDGLTLFAKEDEMQAFADDLFPLAIGQDASVVPGFSTNIVTSAGGHEFRNANWASGRLRFDAGPGVRGEEELGTLIAFFRARRGPAVGFRFLDPFDHSSAGMTGIPSAADQRLGTGDGQRTDFKLVKHYGEGEERRVTRPIPGTVRIALDGVEAEAGWTVEPGGVVRFEVPPEEGCAITAGFRFHVPVRFAEDRLEINRATFAAGEAPSVPLIEIRED